MDTLGNIKKQIRSLVDDPNGSYTDDAFLLPLVQSRYREYETRLNATDSPYEEGVVEITNLAPGTEDLSAFQAPGKLLEFLAQPERISWKPTGADPILYQLFPLYDALPHIDPVASINGWEWRSLLVVLQPALIAVDLEVRGQFQVAPLVDDAAVLKLHPNIGTPLAYGVAALIAVVRGNPQWKTDYSLLEESALEDIEGQMTRAEQGKVRRVGRQTLRRTYSGRTGYPN